VGSRPAAAIHLDPFKAILDSTAVLTPSEGVMMALDVGTSRRIPFGRLVSREVVNGIYVDGAYFYLFAPKTYIPV
jgi:hypothetical protein